MPGGAIIAVLFFVLLTVGGITSMVGLVEPVVSWLEEHRGFSRHKSTLTIMTSIAVLSVASVLSYNLIADWVIFGKDLNGALDYLSNQMLLPLGGFLLALFVGWSVSRQTSEEELNMANATVFRLWHFAIRWLVPSSPRWPLSSSVRPDGNSSR